jgi:AcrR family transcriptional regulator
MTSQRHTISPVTKVDDDVLLDAAKRCVLADGVRRTTLTSVAKAAGVSRMTLYRRFPDVRGLVAALMTREFGTLLASTSHPTEQTARQRLVAMSVAAVKALGADPLMRTVLDRDAELMLPYVFERIGGVQRIAEQFIAETIADGRVDGSIRRGNVKAQARALFLVTQSFVFSMRPATSDVGQTTLITELRRLLDGALRPEDS